MSCTHLGGCGVWNAQTGQELLILQGVGGVSWCSAPTASVWLAACRRDGVGCRDRPGTATSERRWHGSVAFSPDGHRTGHRNGPERTVNYLRRHAAAGEAVTGIEEMAVYSRKPNRIPVPPSNDRIVTAGLVRDSQPFFDARFSCREPIRFVGIALDWAIGRSNGLKGGASNATFFGTRPCRP